MQNTAIFENQLKGQITRFPGTVSLFAHNLATGKTIDVNGSNTSRCASEAKIFILLTYAEQIASGKLNPAKRITLRVSDTVPGSGVLRFAESGLEPTISFLAYLMMSISDNIATNMLLETVGGVEAVQATITRLKIPDVTVRGKIWSGEDGWITSSAHGLARAVEIVASPHQNDYSDIAAKLCKSIMAHHIEDNGMARLLPWSPFASEIVATSSHLSRSWAGIEYYGKAGYTVGYRGDVALFITEQSMYVVGLKIEQVNESQPLNAANDGFIFSAAVGRILYEQWG